jgi:hypothetical protein
MSTATERPDVSLVLEHENIDLVSAQRVTAVLRELARQTREAPFTVELLLPANAIIDEGDIEGLAVRRFHIVPGAHYYEVKNAGAREAKGDVIVLADCDVMPQEGWLVNLVRPFDDPAVDAVTGVTVIRPATTVADKVFATASWFDAHEDDARRQIFANNFAIRPSVFLPLGFPDVGCRYRGSEWDLERSWEARGVRLEVARGARSHHLPPPRLALRALWDGHDQQMTQRATNSAFVPYLLRVVLHQLLMGSVHVVRHRRSVGLRIMQLPLALACNAREAAARGVGFVLARFADGFMHRRVPR